MQKVATQVFMGASIVFGITGIALAIFGKDSDNSQPNRFLMKILMICIFIILPSFALSVADKYLSTKR